MKKYACHVLLVAIVLTIGAAFAVAEPFPTDFVLGVDVSELIAQENSGVTYYDANGNAIAGYTYDAWGNILSITYTSIYGASVSSLNPFRYRGYYYDTESGLYYHNSRYYDAKVGRFINEDEYYVFDIDYKSFENNLYTYCYNNPVKL